MDGKKWAGVLTLVALTLALGVVSLPAQEEAPAEPRVRRGRDAARWQRERPEGEERAAPDAERAARWNPAALQERQLERIRQTLGIGDQEWPVIQPRLERVVTLNNQVALRAARAAVGRRDAEQPADAASPVQAAAAQLRTLLESEDAAARDINERVAALRQARERSEAELEEARAALRELLTVRQEAQLVLMGLLR